MAAAKRSGGTILSFVTTDSRPTFLDPAKAGEAIRAKIAGDKALPAAGLTLTVADAAAKTGLALRDAETGLTWLSKEYRGQLRVTNDGDLVHVFPYGFRKPWVAQDARNKLLKSVGKGVMSGLRFVVRAWVAVVLIAYALLFVALILGLTFARQWICNDDRREGLPGGAIAYAFLRVVGDALFWTFHPWSPFSVYYGPTWYGEPAYVGGYDRYGGGYAPPRQQRADASGPKVPFYERVNRFFFGPPSAEPDPLENERLIVTAIRAGKGRIGLADVMRVTGLPREQADPLMAKLMLDYEGDVDVSEDGGIVYKFPAIRKTASDSTVEREPPPAWSRLKPLPR